MKPLLTLAPMAGFTAKAMRLLCAEQGADLTVTEMISSKAIHYGDKKTDLLAELETLPCRQAIQLFGSDPDIMAEAAVYCENKFEPDMLDINMGCPVKKVAGNGDGSALMRDPVKAAKITEAVVRAVKIPVSVKIRSGWSDEEKNAPELAKMLEAAGCALLTVHGRTKQQLYAPPVDIDIIKKVKDAVSIPVIGNGGINTPEDALEMIENTGCDGVALARGALGNPWLFAQIRALLDGKEYTVPGVWARLETAKRHLELEIADKGEYTGIRESRVQLAHYLYGLRGAAQARLNINLCDTKEGIFDILDRLIEENE